MSTLSHFDDAGASRMVDVGNKQVTRRSARASGRVTMATETLALLRGSHVAGTRRVPSACEFTEPESSAGDGTPTRHPAEPAAGCPVPATLSKGDVLEVARLAGIMAAKRTAELIPLCHPLPLDSVTVDFTYFDDRTLAIEAVVCVESKTGVEMEALTAVSIAALTVYDMCKSVDRGITIGPIQLEEKSGGRSGHWTRAAL
jgi:cyclic pyranopterin monophosphate synthase